MQSVGVNYCSNCQSELLESSRFCTVCGEAKNKLEFEKSSKKKDNLITLALFFSIELLFCASALFITDFTIGLSLFYDFALAITTLFFFASSWKETNHLSKWPDFSVKKLALLIPLTIIASALVQYAVRWLNFLLFDTDFTFSSTYMGHEYGKYIMIISVALFPAVFEELAYRGFLMQKLLNIMDQREAMYLTSILFFLIHFSMVSFYWMLPFAVLLAYIRIRERTIWYGVIIHFFFNFTACMFEIYQFNRFF